MDINDRTGKVFNYSVCADFGSGNQGDKTDYHYRLRHMNTGRLVIDQEIEINGMKMRTLGLAPHVCLKNLHHMSEKQLETVNGELKELDKTSAYYIEDLQSAKSPGTYAELDRRSRFRIISTSPSLDTRIKSNSCV